MILQGTGHASDNAFMLLRAEVSDESEELVTSVQTVQIIICLDHLITDGIGTRILFGKYLSLLALSLNKPSNATAKEHNWDDSHKNLSVPFICVMNHDQITSGPQYEKIAAWNRVVLLEKMVRSNFVLSMLSLWSIFTSSSLLSL